MNFSLYIAKRYLFSKTSTNAINIITAIAVFGGVVGTLALFVVLSGFSGLKTFSDSLLNASDPDIKITAAQGKSLEYSTKLHEILQQEEAIKAYSKVVEERVFLKYKDRDHIAQIKGVDTNYSSIIPTDSILTVGTWIDEQYKNTAVIGYGISYKLSLGIFNFGEPLQVLVPKPGKGSNSVRS